MICRYVDKLIDWWVDFVFGPQEDFEFTGSTTPYEERKSLEDG